MRDLPKSHKRQRGLRRTLVRQRLSVEHLESRRVLAAYYVSADNGADSNSGGIGDPFETIGRAALVAQSGDTVFIRQGTYREQVNVAHSGTQTNPITFTAFNSEDVVLSGGDLVTGWTQQSGDLWTATANWNADNDRDSNTLFVDGEFMSEGRQYAENDILEIDDWGLMKKGRLSTNATTFTVDDLGGFGNDYWNGAKIRFHTLDWVIQTKTITDFSSSGTITVDSPIGSVNQKQDTGYYIYDTLNAVDEPGEWYKQNGGNTLYYHTEPGQNPNTLEIEFKRRAFGFDVRGKDYIHIKDIDFRGVSISADGNTDYNVYEGNRFYAYDKGNFGRFYITGDHNIFRDNEVSHTWNAFATVDGVRNEIVNNYIHDIGFYGTARVMSAVGADELLLSHNTISTFARSFLDGYPSRSEIAHNLIEDGGNLSWDTGVFDSDGGNGNSSQSIFHHNVLRDMDTRGIYEGFYGRNDNTVIHHNLFYNFTGSGRPLLRSAGLDFRQAYHNTVISDFGAAPAGSLEATEAVQTRYNNNLQITMERMEALGVDVRGNHNYSTSDFVNFAANNYQLAGSSDAIDAGIVLPGINDGYLGSAPDAGAFEFGAPAWQAGHDFVTEPTPVYAWQSLPGSNLYDNGHFLKGIGDWVTQSGSPNSADRNSWNLAASGMSLTGTFRTQSVELTPGESMNRTFTGLAPNTTYTLGAVARVINQITVGDAYSGSSGSIGTGTHRDESYVTGLTSGEWVRYNGINFGEPGQFDRLAMLHIRDPAFLSGSIDGITVQVRLDSPAGPLLTEITDLSDGNGTDVWRANTVAIAPTSGVHDIYVSVSGVNSANLAIGSMRLTKDALPTRDLLTVEMSSFGTPPVSAQIGNDEWIRGYEELVFKTGPATTSAIVEVSNNGRLNAYLDRLYIIEDYATRGATPTDISTGAAAELSLTPTTSGPANGVTDGLTGNLTITGDHPGSWIQIDLGAVKPIYGVQLFNAASSPERMSNFRLSMWNADPRLGGTELWSQDYFDDGQALSANQSLFVQANTFAGDNDRALGTVQARFVRVENLGINNAGDNQLALGEIKVLSLDENNFAVSDSEATQSSTLSNQEALNAIDGDASTLSETDPAGFDSWWQTRFSQPFSIGQIKLTNRDDNDFAELSNFAVSVWDEDPSAGGTKLWEKDYYSSGSVGRGQSLTIDGSEISDLDGYSRLATMHRGRVVRVQLNGTNNAGNGRLALADVRVTSGDKAMPIDNVALTGIAEHSNDFYSNWGFASEAQDGIISTASNFTSTLNEPGAWWQVDLQGVSAIDQIVVFNRTDAANRLNNFRVTVWDDDPTSGGSELWGRTYFYSSGAPFYSTSSIGPGGALIIKGDATDNGLRLDDVTGGQYVRVQLNGSNILSLAEIQVWQPDTLIRVPVDATDLAYDVGTTLSAVASGFQRVSPASYGDLWWLGDIQAVDRGGSGTDRDFVSGDTPATLHHTLPNGGWRVTVEMGDPILARQDMMLWAEDQLISADIDTAAGQTTELTFDVLLEDGELNLAFDSAGANGWALNSVQLESLNVPVDLPGDYNDNGIVDAADFTVWRDNNGQNVFIPNDVTPGVVDMDDYWVWVNNFGAVDPNPVTTVLVDATTGNGEFNFDDPNTAYRVGGGTDSISTDVSRDRALRSTGTVGRGVGVPGWQIVRRSYSGGNSALGLDGTFGFATNAGTGPGQTGQAFVNSNAADVTSDTIAHSFSAGDVIDLSYLLGSDGLGPPTVDADVQLIFDAGLGSEYSHQFSTRSATGLTTPALTEQYTVPSSASTLTLVFGLDGNQVGVRTLLDQVEVAVTTQNGGPSSDDPPSKKEHESIGTSLPPLASNPSLTPGSRADAAFAELFSDVARFDSSVNTPKSFWQSDLALVQLSSTLVRGTLASKEGLEPGSSLPAARPTFSSSGRLNGDLACDPPVHSGGFRIARGWVA